MYDSRQLKTIAAAALLGAASALSTPVIAQKIGLPVGKLLGDASDNALGKLAQPGAFFADEAVRIALPGPLKKASGLMKFADQAGVTNGLTKSLNDAAGMAASEAKPIFRTAINQMSVKDAPGIISKGDGGTQYLRQSAGTELQAKVRPLIVSALGRTGAFTQLDKIGKGSSLLGGAGISRDGLSDSVTDQAMNGIFKYMGAEEAKLRANPLGAAGKLFKRP